MRTTAAAAGAFAHGFPLSPAWAGPVRPPNLIVMMADDLGAAELGCYGNETNRTPNLDRLAESGITFETCYACPICHPSRFEIMTGQYGHHNGVYNFGGRRGGPKGGSDANDIAKKLTFAHLLREAGYATAMVGKWQLSGEVPNLVHEAGFDEYCMWAYKHNLPAGVTHTGAWEGKPGGRTSRYWHPSILQNGTYRPTSPDDYGPDIFAHFAIDFMKRHRDEPFLVYYPMALTHDPYYTTPITTQTPEDRHINTRDNWQANVEYADRIVGRLVDALERLGLRQNTVLMFSGDNGTGFRGKAQPTELGARVPMVVNGPGIVKPRGSRPELVDLSDLLPTLTALAGIPLPGDRPIDGVSFDYILKGEPGRDREWIYSYIGDRRILRDRRWLWEDNSPLHEGRLYDCGDSRDGTGYQEVTDIHTPEVDRARQRLKAILAGLPVPILDYEGPAAELNKDAEQRIDGAPEWNPELLTKQEAWKARGGTRLTCGPEGLTVALPKGQKRGVIQSAKTWAAGQRTTHVVIDVDDLSRGASWFFKLAGSRFIDDKRFYAAHASYDLSGPGTIRLPLDPLVLEAGGKGSWTIKLGLAGPAGSTMTVSRLRFE